MYNTAVEIDVEAIRRQVLKEFEDLKTQPLPIPGLNWDLVWVISGPDVTFEENPEVNQTRRRLLTGLDVSRVIAGLRSRVKPDQLSLNQLTKVAPSIFFNGWERHNVALRRTLLSGVLENDHAFPSNKIIVADEGIQNTKDQAASFPKKLVEASRKIVVVTDAYHIPRTRRYFLWPDSAVPYEQLVFYPAQPLSFPEPTTQQEADKIIEYTLKGDLPNI